MKIPDTFEKKIQQDQALYGLVLEVVSDNSFGRILKDNKLFFFEEYTNHGIEHTEMVLKTAEFLIPDESFQYIQPKEVAILILAVVLHDIGMHAEFSTFKAMIDGKYNNVRVGILDEKTWQELWEDYLSEVRHWSSKQLENVFGKLEKETINVIKIIEDIKNAIRENKKDNLNGKHKKLIGEFLRRNHARLAHEIALNGFIGNDTISFGNRNINNRYKQFAGIVARSHGINIRSTFDYLKSLGLGRAWKNTEGINLVYLMVLLRIADILQIDETRTNLILLKIKNINSSISLKEHKKHLTILNVNYEMDDPELIYVECKNPENAQLYVEIQDLIKYIQHEFDLSWAILGETYGLSEKTNIKFRRIDSNLEDKGFLNTISYVPQKISFQVNNELSKLLVAPLYSNNPTYGVRELVQNATDACKERMKIEQDKGNTNYEPLVTVSIDKINEENYLFKIIDNGKGMALDEILNYFLSVGSSFRKSLQWKQEFTSADGKSLVNRNGQFGIGILAAFLLGDKISVKTKSYKDNSPTYEFTADMDADFIDVKTITDFEIGTEIGIILPEKTLNNLKKSGNNKISWTDWYIGKIPKVQYLLNDEFQSPKKFFKILKKREITPNNYDKVQWVYSKDIKGNYDMFVSCNDIIVTLGHYNKFPNLYSEVIIFRPHLLIADSQGNLTLSLNRNNLDTWFPFEEELFENVAKDFIAQILMMSIPLETLKKQSLFPHNADFLYFKNGFSLALDYFVNKIKDKILLRILTRDGNTIKNASLILNQYPNFILFPLFSQLYTLRGQGEKVAPDTNSHILLQKQQYEQYFNNEGRNRIRYWLKNRHKIQWQNDKFVAYTMNNFQSQLTLFNENEFSKIIDQIDNNVLAIQEIPIKYLPVKRGGIILNQLLETYIGDNIIIPYDMEERRKLYEDAFSDLQDYMKDYEEN